MMRLASALCLVGAASAVAIERKGSQLIDEGDFVHRPAHWKGIEKPNSGKKDEKKLDQYGTGATHHHGACQPYIASSSKGPVGYDTYRVYLIFDDDVGRNLYAVFGDEYSALSVHTDDGTAFFNVEAPFGTNTGGVHPAMFEVKPEAEFDSWLTFNQGAALPTQPPSFPLSEFDCCAVGGRCSTEPRCPSLSLSLPLPLTGLACCPSAEDGESKEKITCAASARPVRCVPAASRQIPCLSTAVLHRSIGLDWDPFNSDGPLETSDGAVRTPPTPLNGPPCTAAQS